MDLFLVINNHPYGGAPGHYARTYLTRESAENFIEEYKERMDARNKKKASWIILEFYLEETNKVWINIPAVATKNNVYVFEDKEEAVLDLETKSKDLKYKTFAWTLK